MTSVITPGKLYPFPTVQLEPRSRRALKYICIESNPVSSNKLNLDFNLESLSNSHARCQLDTGILTW